MKLAVFLCLLGVAGNYLFFALLTSTLTLKRIFEFKKTLKILKTMFQASAFLKMIYIKWF